MKMADSQFRIERKKHYAGEEPYRLVHRRSGELIQIHLRDFTSRREAKACVRRMLSAAPDWDWSHPDLFEAMDTELFRQVVAAIYVA
jgi:hypothetical protein